MKTYIPHPEIEQLVRVNVNGSRWYQTPEGKRYPSVTSVTGFAGKESIQEWKDKIGHEEANRISTTASTRGTNFHSLCESYLNNEIVIPDMFTRENWDIYKPLLDRIDNIHGNEIMLYSDLLQVAGTADCIGEFDGVLSIVDFKTSRKWKHKDWITNYFQQCCFYALAFRERTGISVNQIVVLISVDDEEPQVFKESVFDWLKSTKECRDNYRLATGE